MKFVTAAKVADLQPGQCMSVEVEGHCVALFNLDSHIYALDNTCPHAGGPLGEGSLHGEFVKCPWHGWKFNVRTGERQKPPGDEWAVTCYQVRLEDEHIQVLLPTIEVSQVPADQDQ